MKRKNDINNYESKHLFQLDIEDYYERLNNLLSLNETRKTSELIEFIDLEKINTVLKIAIQRNNIQIVEFLLNNGADENAAVALIFSTDNQEIVIAVLTHIDPNIQDIDGCTPLMILIKLNQPGLNNLEIAQLLIARGVNVNAAGNDGNTPLGWSLFHGYSDIASLLKKHGANINSNC